MTSLSLDHLNNGHQTCLAQPKRIVVRGWQSNVAGDLLAGDASDFVGNDKYHGWVKISIPSDPPPCFQHGLRSKRCRVLLIHPDQLQLGHDEMEKQIPWVWPDPVVLEIKSLLVNRPKRSVPFSRLEILGSGLQQANTPIKTFFFVVNDCPSIPLGILRLPLSNLLGCRIAGKVWHNGNRAILESPCNPILNQQAIKYRVPLPAPSRLNVKQHRHDFWANLVGD